MVRGRERDCKTSLRSFAGTLCKMLVVPFNDIPFGALFSTNAVLRSYWLLVKL